jgi:plastocyanin
MKKIIVSAAVLSALIILSGCGPSTDNQNNPPHAPSGTSASQSQPSAADENNADAVSIQNFSFNPGTLTVKKGATVTWINNDSASHTIKSNSFNSGNLAKGGTFKFTFNDSGAFDYFCGIHPSMTGKIVVE